MRLKIAEGNDKQWRVILVADNGETLNISEGYVSKWNAERAAKYVFPNLMDTVEYVPMARTK